MCTLIKCFEQITSCYIVVSVGQTPPMFIFSNYHKVVWPARLIIRLRLLNLKLLRHCIIRILVARQYIHCLIGVCELVRNRNCVCH